MVWSHYKNESNLANVTPQNDDKNVDDELPDNVELEYNDWCTCYSDDLFNMWMGLKAYVQDAVMEDSLLCFSDYDDFCTYVFNHSKTKKKKVKFFS